MDATKKPLRIPPDFSIYAEEHSIFDMYKKLSFVKLGDPASISSSKPLQVYKATRIKFLKNLSQSKDNDSQNQPSVRLETLKTQCAVRSRSIDSSRDQTSLDLFSKRLLSQIIIDQPFDPIQFTIEWLKRENNNVPQIAILGPTASGKSGISAALSKRINAVHVDKAMLLDDDLSDAASKANKLMEDDIPVPDAIWIQLIHERLSRKDSVRRGYVLEDFPKNRYQARELQSKGILLKHVVVLDAPDTVLVERQSGKRVDRITGDIYHTTFDWPQDPTVQARLLEPEGISEAETRKKLNEYARHIHGVAASYPVITKMVNADQPKADVLAQTMTFVNSRLRSEAPRTPRIVLIGPTGSGKSTIAQKLAQKYRLVDVSCGTLIKEHVSNESRLGQAVREFVLKDELVPNTLVNKIVVDRLTELDASTRGWVLHGFPMMREQADGLADAGIKPNRVYFLDIPDDCVIERLCYRLTDPISGERYHTLYNPPRSAEVKQRCLRHPTDSDEAVRVALNTYRSFSDELTDYYVEEGAIRINADQDPQTVFEYVEDILVNPLPNRLGDDN